MSFSYPDAQFTILSNLCIQFGRGWTLIAGANGSGKTTLLALATGILQPESGTIMLPEQAHICYCPQKADILPDNWEDFWYDMTSDVRKICSLLHIEEDFPYRFETLSGGEKKRFQTAIALCASPDILILDEPTNHLDIESKRIITEALRLYDGIGLLVSHDRSLADSVCTHTVYLAESSYRCYDGGLSIALALREAENIHARKAWHNAQRNVDTVSAQVQYWAQEQAQSKSRISKSNLDIKDHDGKAKINVARLTGKDAVAAHAKRRTLSTQTRVESHLHALEKPHLRKEGISLTATSLHSDTIAIISSGSIGNDDSYCIDISELYIKPSSRIALVGNNGTGKTMLIRHIMQHIEESGREDVLYIPQEISQERALKALHDFDSCSDAEKGAILSQLYRLGSEPTALLQHLQNALSVNLSPGELRKLLFAQALEKSLSLIVLDEPTNHLDIPSIIMLETALKTANAALVLVSHDETFSASLTQELWIMEKTADQRGRLRMSFCS